VKHKKTTYYEFVKMSYQWTKENIIFTNDGALKEMHFKIWLKFFIVSIQQLHFWLIEDVHGEINEFGSVHNGNCMSCLELNAQFDPFLFEHMAKYENKVRGSVSFFVFSNL